MCLYNQIKGMMSKMWNKRKYVNLNHSLWDAQCAQQLTKTTRKGMEGHSYRRCVY